MSGDAPALKDLPKIEGSVKDELIKQHDLKKVEAAQKDVVKGTMQGVLEGVGQQNDVRASLNKVETTEKVVLPSAEDLKQEKAVEGVLKGVEDGVKLTPVKTKEPASALELAKSEMAQRNSLEQVANFDANKLKHVETAEKNPLPDSDSIKAEAEHMKFKEGIEGFAKDQLKHSDTVEKNTLPTKEVIEQEKAA